MMFTGLAGRRFVRTRASSAVATMVILAATFPAGAGDPQSGEARARSAARIEANVRFLADDLLEGREAGTRGFDLAALYVATQYRLVGLEPAAEVFEWLESGQVRASDLSGEATLATRARLERVASHNVVGRLAGRDAQLSREHVAFLAHLDHLGIGAAVDGDVIYNGAQDNAVGVATLLEAARLLAANPERPKRSMLFLALTAEEKGLLGAFQFAAEPTVPRPSLVATINMDMPLPLSDASDVVAIGIEHSTLQSVAERAVAEAGLAMTPDPFADEVLFVRSDQYPFVREGVPAIVLLAGVKPRDGSDGLQRFREFLATRYHQPSDDLNYPIHWLGAADLAMLNFRIGLAVGNDPERPAWNPGDFFGRQFGR
jgi:Zn-dependent M28 family amino/carboxypeptidase